MACYPWWHTAFERFKGMRYPSLPACAQGSNGDQVDRDPESRTFGDVVCSPETLRKWAELQMNKMGVWEGTLPIDVYSVARNITSEMGSGSVEERMAVALTTINEARRRKMTPTRLILINKTGGTRYGIINDSSGVNFGRFTSSSKEPTVENIHIAAFALSGKAGKFPLDFVHGGNDQAQASIITPARHAADRRQYWVGPIVGVDGWATMIMRTRPEVDPKSPEGQILIRRAEEMCGASRGGRCSTVKLNREVIGDCIEVFTDDHKRVIKAISIAAGFALVGGVVLAAVQSKPGAFASWVKGLLPRPT